MKYIAFEIAKHSEVISDLQRTLISHNIGASDWADETELKINSVSDIDTALIRSILDSFNIDYYIDDAEDSFRSFGVTITEVIFSLNYVYYGNRLLYMFREYGIQYSKVFDRIFIDVNDETELNIIRTLLYRFMVDDVVYK